MGGKGLCIFSWEILDPCIRVNATYCTVIVAGQIHSFMESKSWWTLPLSTGCKKILRHRNELVRQCSPLNYPALNLKPLWYVLKT